MHRGIPKDGHGGGVVTGLFRAPVSAYREGFLCFSREIKGAGGVVAYELVYPA